jgi:DNA-binding phage protein
MPRSKPDWRRFLDILPLRDKIPFQALGVQAFAERAGISRSALTKAIRTGKIPRDCCFCKIRPNGERQLFIDWNRGGYSFMLARRPKDWPPDFRPNEAREYKPIKKGDPLPNKKVGGPRRGNSASPVSPPPASPGAPDPSPPASVGPGGSLPPSALDEAAEGDSNVLDMGAAKLKIEKLKIEKMEAELRQANGELLPREEVLAVYREIALELKAELTKMINHMVPAVRAADTVIRARAVAKEHIRKSLEKLRNMERGEYGKTRPS